jgi:hypothetical protein
MVVVAVAVVAAAQSFPDPAPLKRGSRAGLPDSESKLSYLPINKSISMCEGLKS